MVIHQFGYSYLILQQIANMRLDDCHLVESGVEHSLCTRWQTIGTLIGNDIELVDQ
jgi:hypothetical protein